MLVAVERAADGVSSLIVEHEVRMPAGTLQPAVDAFAIGGEGLADCSFGSGAIGVGGCGGDVGLAIETFAQFVVGFTNVALKDVAAAALVSRKVVCLRGALGAGWGFLRRGFGLIAGTTAGARQAQDDSEKD